MNSPIPTCLYLAHVALLEDPTNPRYKSAAGVSVRADVAWLLVFQGTGQPVLEVLVFCGHLAAAFSAIRRDCSDEVPTPP